MSSLRTRRFTPWLLVASLLFGLWAAAVHGDHAGAPAAHADACAVCAFTGGLGGGLHAAVAALSLGVAASVFAAPRVLPPRRARRLAVRARGPPSQPA
jgi:hypothetical protein